MKENVIDIKDLTVHFQSREIGVCKAVNHFSLSIKRGETIGLVGETGAGKTTVALSIMRLLQMPPAVIKSGEILYEGQDVLKFSKKQKSSPEIAIFTPCGCLITPNYPYLPLNYLTNSFLQVFF